MTIWLPDEEATLALAGRLFPVLARASLIFLSGDLGAGKTTFVRGCLRAAGYSGPVKSPTFTLVEEYAIAGRSIFHFDLYRIADPEELEGMGIRDYFRDDALCFIEWAERAKGFLPAPDLEIRLTVEGSGRRMEIQPRSGLGQGILADIDDLLEGRFAKS
jgi:tRNA threonylcarbamoyladenosine biosynthesis protein TsaE